jgi:hypothetical protein
LASRNLALYCASSSCIDRSKCRKFHFSSPSRTPGDIICPSLVQGIDYIRDPRLNKGLAFTLEERQALGIHGLMPPKFKTQEEQLEVCRFSVMKYQEDLNKFLYLAELQVINLLHLCIYLTYFNLKLICRIEMKGFILGFYLKIFICYYQLFILQLLD